MKQLFNSRTRQMLTMLAFLLCGTFMAGRVEAQSNMIGGDVTHKQHYNYNWVLEAEAITILEAQLTDLANKLSLYQPGSGAYKNVVFHMTYYKLILSYLEQGETVPVSVLKAFDDMVNVEGYATDADPTFTNQNLVDLYQEVVDMLTY